MSRRSESVEDTRARIVRATFDLHAEKGIAATSMRDIAERADVSIGTVYHHFPTYQDAIVACGAYTQSLAPLPDESLFSGLADPASRLHALVAAQFDFYRRVPAYAHVRADRDKFEPLLRFVDEEEANRRRLLLAALKPRGARRRALAMAFALLDQAVYRSLREQGLPHDDAVDDLCAQLGLLLLAPGSCAAAPPLPNPDQEVP